jgi:hypothetical protein
MNDLMTDEEILQSNKRNDAFISGEGSIKGLPVRPFTAGSLLICKRVGNSLVGGEKSENPEFDVLSFIYIHTAPIEEVRKNAFNKETFWASVTKWADNLTVKDIEEAGSLVEKIISNSGIGIVSPTANDSGDSSPN